MILKKELIQIAKMYVFMGLFMLISLVVRFNGSLLVAGVGITIFGLLGYLFAVIFLKDEQITDRNTIIDDLPLGEGEKQALRDYWDNVEREVKEETS